MEEKKRILVVDDEEKIVDVIKSYLEKVGYEVFTAYDGKRALQLARTVNPNIIILDLMLPDISGEDVCISIRKNSNVPIIMLTAKVEEENILAGLNIGADDYVTKPFSPRQLVARVNAILRRVGVGTGVAADILSYRDNQLIIDIQKHTVTLDGTEISLTPNEFNILVILAKHPKRVFSRDELIDKTMGNDFDGFDRVIDTHIKNLRQKIEKEPKTPLYILTVHGVGYRFGGD